MNIYYLLAFLRIRSLEVFQVSNQFWNQGLLWVAVKLLVRDGHLEAQLGQENPLSGSLTWFLAGLSSSLLVSWRLQLLATLAFSVGLLIAWQLAQRK